MSRRVPLPALAERLAFLRAEMKAVGVDGVIIPHNDAHGSEYIAEVDERLFFISGELSSIKDYMRNIAAGLTKNLVDLRVETKAVGVYGAIIPHVDAHGSACIAEVDQRLFFISGFDGSSGTAVITQTRALLWTDGRYFLQAGEQFGEEWKLMKDRLPETPTPSKYILDKLGKTAKIGIDPKLISVEAYRALGKEGVSVRCLDENLVDKIWKDQPARPTSVIRVMGEEVTGESTESKLQKLRKDMETNECTVAVVSQLDEVAWMLNMRAGDIDFNPLFFSFLVVHRRKLSVPGEEVAGPPEKAVLFIDGDRFNKEGKEALEKNGIEIRPYSAVYDYLRSDENIVKDGGLGDKVWVDKDFTNAAIFVALEGCHKVHEATLPVAKWKAVKNSVEMEGARASHKRDGLAKTRWLYWMETQLSGPNPKPVSELEAAEKLCWFRSQQPLFAGLSFPAISSSGPNAAIIHYHPTKDHNSPVDPASIYLIDSGGQYDDGTTDTTRTVHFSTPTEIEKDAFTRVLKGVIGISRCKFPPKTTTGAAFDILGRLHLWELGLEFRHSIGHGVGSYLCVHEGPIGIGPPTAKTRLINWPFEVGHLMSNEPGYYRDGDFGIRIENVMVVVDSDIKMEFQPEKKMLTFETVTRVPIQKKMMKVSLLSPQEIAWLDDYHQLCWNDLKDGMQGEKELAWLQEACAPIAATAHIKEAASPKSTAKPNDKEAVVSEARSSGKAHAKKPAAKGKKRAPSPVATKSGKKSKR